MHSFPISGQLIDLFQKRIYPANIIVNEGVIQSIKEVASAPNHYILPGFIDAHIHIESSMLVPSSFAQLAVVHGTVATVSDPHEIANVNGIEGVQYMIDNSKLTPFKFFFGAPSCVPATVFETAGACLDAIDVENLLNSKDIWYLSEMMNYPGVLKGDKEVIAKLEAAKKANKPVDGHAPGLFGKSVIDYASVGITTDHECFMIEEALEKINAGMQILIREGSAAKNYNALCELINLYPEKVMFCSDDKHPDELVLSHINQLVKRSLQNGYNLFDVLKVACINPVNHYKIPVGLLRINDPADFIVVNNLNDFDVIQTYISGQLVAENGKSLLPFIEVKEINNFKASVRQVDDFKIKCNSLNPIIRVIEAIEDQLITKELQFKALIKNGCIISDIGRDILKIVVINRYQQHAPIAFGFIKNFGLKQGAIASTVGHDCHNVIAIGADDASLCAAVNAIIKCKGGISVAVNEHDIICLPLPIAGLMSDKNGYQIALDYATINTAAKNLGSTLIAPFMTLSFMALLVIPILKLSDKGLFDGSCFQFVSLEV